MVKEKFNGSKSGGPHDRQASDHTKYTSRRQVPRMRTTLARGPKQNSSRSMVKSVGKAEHVVSDAAALTWLAWLIFSNIIHTSNDTE
jgi:hypothetical protein